MRVILLLFILLCSRSVIFGQNSFSPVTTKLVSSKIKGLTELSCSMGNTIVKFKLKRSLTHTEEKNFVIIDGQIIQITPLKYSGYIIKKGSTPISQEKEILRNYSNYELVYFEKELGLEIINPNSQWVTIKSKGWYIWYFRVGNIDKNIDEKMEIQLFATTIIGDKILTINAPVVAKGDFKKAGEIVNEMIETFQVSK